MTTPLVSVCCITYNHAQFIRKCLDGFLMQETSFPIEILIHDDCSTDGTTEIIREYEAKYPDLIFPLYEEENQYQQGKAAEIDFYNYRRARGKYIAYCEGDDYWTDPLKLQKQVDFMEANPEYGLCYTDFNFCDELPVRLDFFDNELENISNFSITDFKKIQSFKQIGIVPTTIIPFIDNKSQLFEKIYNDFEKTKKQLDPNQAPISPSNFEEFKLYFDSENFIICKGLHEPIISDDEYTAAQKRIYEQSKKNKKAVRRS